MADTASDATSRQIERRLPMTLDPLCDLQAQLLLSFPAASYAATGVYVF